ncbi:proteasomal ATPase-associated factor 1-like isoform X2 [Pristis pectinata]|uniref:proteasomal ATPase-associated factor 1-like isoform X2 n=1 Tax=Pristis pectinata TaxID=685728 RepID=UPI00223D3F59|nr:proteasomal ATPase-associated factor 1-like isoform X2 [Pristis pectinata]
MAGGRIFIQSDWARALWENEREAWVSCKIPGATTLYGCIKCQGVGKDGIPVVTASEGFEVTEVTKKSILISCPDGNAASKFLMPYAIFSRIHTKSITSMDISSGGGLGVSCSTDGTMRVWQANNGELRRELVGHVYDVNTCRFFPSGIVILSGGMDAQLKIWSVEDGNCSVTLNGHKGGILDTAIVERGRNVISSSRDGTVRLWDCGMSTCLAVLADCGTPINGCSVGVAENTLNLGSPKHQTSEREIGTEGKLLLLAREDRKLQSIGLLSREPEHMMVTFISWMSETQKLPYRLSIDQVLQSFPCCPIEKALWLATVMGAVILFSRIRIMSLNLQGLTVTPFIRLL